MIDFLGSSDLEGRLVGDPAGIVGGDALSAFLALSVPSIATLFGDFVVLLPLAFLDDGRTTELCFRPSKMTLLEECWGMWPNDINVLGVTEFVLVSSSPLLTSMFKVLDNSAAVVVEVG